VGASALAGTGAFNVAVGFQALDANTTGNTLVAVGHNSLGANTTGEVNTAVGQGSLQTNTTGNNNTAVGVAALSSNTTASNNIAVGYQAGYGTTTGINNVFIGNTAGFSNTTGDRSVYVGDLAGNLTTGRANTFIGTDSGYLITTGTKNTILGRYTGNQGGLDIRTADNHIVLSDGDGNPRMFFNANGNAHLTQVPSGAGTNALRFNTGTGLITYDTSSARYKDNIRDSIYGLSHVMQMRSTQFEYKDDGRSDVGLVAEELDLIVPELVGKNKDGQPDSVSYDRMVSVLVKAIQELNAKVEALEAQLKGN
jgi:hypothetical protein